MENSHDDIRATWNGARWIVKTAPQLESLIGKNQNSHQVRSTLSTAKKAIQQQLKEKMVELNEAIQGAEVRVKALQDENGRLRQLNYALNSDKVALKTQYEENLREERERYETNNGTSAAEVLRVEVERLQVRLNEATSGNTLSYNSGYHAAIRTVLTAAMEKA